MNAVRFAVPGALALALAILAACSNLFGGGAINYTRHDLDDRGPPVHDFTTSGSDTPLFAPRRALDAGADSSLDGAEPGSRSPAGD